MKTTRNLLLSLSLLAFVGCASVTNELTVVDPATGVVRKTKTRATEFFDAKTQLAKWKTSNAEKTQTVGLDGLDTSAHGTNVVEALKAIDSILGKLAK